MQDFASHADLPVGADIRLVLSDIDGTLVGADHHPIPASKPYIHELMEYMPLCLVSARSPEGIFSVQKPLDIHGAYAAYSGAYVVDASGRELYSTTIPLSAALAIKEYLTRALPHIAVGTYAFNTWIVDDAHNIYVEREAHFVQTSPAVCRDLSSVFDERGIHKFLLMGEPTDIAQAEQTLALRYPELFVVRSNDILCEIMNKNASKKKAAELLCKAHGVLPENAAAFGDGPNDLDMLDAVSYSFAMKNAEDQVKARAHFLCPWTNEECGVPRTILAIHASNSGHNAAHDPGQHSS